MLLNSEKASLSGVLRRMARRADLSWLCNLALAGLVMFAGARCSLFGGMQIAAAPLFAAGIAAGFNCGAMLAGCALGCASLHDTACIWPFFACLTVWLVICVLRNSGGMDARGGRARSGFGRLCAVARGDTGAAAFRLLAGCVAGGANLLMSLPVAYGSVAGIVYCAVNAVMGFGLAPVMCLALDSQCMAESGAWQDGVARALLAGILPAGIRGIELYGFAIQPFVSVALLTWLAARATAGMRSLGRRLVRGGMLGLTVAGCALIEGEQPLMCMAYAIAGALAASGMNIMLSAASCALTALALALLDGAALVPWLVCVGAGRLAGGLGQPSGSIKGVGAALNEFYEHCREDEMQQRRNAAARLKSDLYEIMGMEAPQTGGRELEMLRRSMCGGCERNAVCWQRAAGNSHAAFEKLRAGLHSGGEIRPELLPRGCVRVFQAQKLLENAVHAIAFEHICSRTVEERRAELPEGLGNAGADLRRYAAIARRPLDEKSSLELRRRLRGQGMGRVMACITAGEPRFAYIKPEAGRAECQSAPEGILHALRVTTGLEFELVHGGNVLLFRQCSPLAVGGSTRRHACGSDKCGDSTLLRKLPDGRWLAAVSDGMGQGDHAAGESHAALAAMDRLLGEGISPENAVELANAMLQLRDEGEMYATLDIVLIDGWNACADIYKLGAVPSLLIDAGEARVITACAPPFGILEHVTPAHRHIKLHRGDRLIMLSDGLCDFSDVRQARAFTGMALALGNARADSTAEKLITRMRARFNTGDDAAAVVLDITGERTESRRWRKKRGHR